MDATPSSLYKGHRYPVEIISHCVWLYHRFPLSLREVEEMMMARGVLVTHETIHQWCRKFGQTYANQLRRRRARPGDKWHLDEVFKIQGKSHYLWRAVDQDGNVLDLLVSSRRDARSATRFFRKLLRGWRSVPWVLVTDKLASQLRRSSPPVDVWCGASSIEVSDNRAENSHQPTRQRERAMKKFTSPGGAQRFLSAFSGISPHFRPRRHRLHADAYRREMTSRFATWNEVVGLPTAA